MGNYVPLPPWIEIFHIGGEGRKLTPRPLYGTSLMERSKYVAET